MRGKRKALGVGLCLLLLFGSQSALAASRQGRSHRPKVLSRTVKADVGSPRPSRKVLADADTVSFTVLPGDTHVKLALDLTGSDDNHGVFRRLNPDLTPGEKLRVPADLLLPGLADKRREVLVFGRDFPTMWGLARRTNARSPAEVGRTARNLQRLNALLDGGRIAAGTRVEVPKGLLGDEEQCAVGVTEKQTPQPEEPAARRGPREPRDAGALEVRKQYRTRDLDGLERRGGSLSPRLRHFLSDRELERAHAGRGEVSLVVVHSTEHRGSTFENTAAYIQRKRLANYLIGPDGAVYEIVPEEYRAFGCGDSLWDGKYGVDLEAINIEIFANTERGDPQGSISDVQYEGLRQLLADIRARRPKIGEERVVTHRMVALNFKIGTRSRKGDPYEFDWGKAGLPDNSRVPDPDMLDGRAKLCTDLRFTDRITAGQTEAARILQKL